MIGQGPPGGHQWIWEYTQTQKERWSNDGQWWWVYLILINLICREIHLPFQLSFFSRLTKHFFRDHVFNILDIEYTYVRASRQIHYGPNVGDDQDMNFRGTSVVEAF